MQIAENVLKLYDAVCRIIDLRLDSVEFAYLKMVSVFSWNLPGLAPSIRRHIDRLQEKAVQELVAYEKKTDHVDRASKLLLRTTPLRQLKVNDHGKYILISTSKQNVNDKNS